MKDTAIDTPAIPDTSEPDATVSSAPDAPDADSRHWPVSVALVTTWLRPATTAQRTRHTSLLEAWLMHFVAAIFAALAMVFVESWVEAPPGATVLSAFIDTLGKLTEDFLHEYRIVPYQIIAGVVGTVLAVEMSFVGLALFAMPWGAKDEPLRKSYRNAIRYAWLHTSALIAVVIAIGISAAIFDGIERDWRQAHPTAPWPTRPQRLKVASDDPSFQQAMADYDAATAQYDAQRKIVQREWSINRAQMPWYIRPWEPLVMGIGFMAGILWLWGLLRGVGARRDVIPIARPPTCEDCGYNLLTIPIDSRCPECGEPVVKSLGEEARGGPPWRRRHEIGNLSAWWRTAFLAVRNPAELGRRLRIVDPGTSHRRFLAMHVPLVFPLGAGGVLATAIATAPEDILRRELPIVMSVATIFGLACMLGMTLFTMFAAWLVGLSWSQRSKRNLLPGAMQVACYLAPVLVLWAVFGLTSGWGVLFLVEADWFRVVEAKTGIYHGFGAAMSWFVPNIACGVLYLALVSRGTSATCYANR